MEYDQSVQWTFQTKSSFGFMDQKALSFDGAISIDKILSI